MIPVSGIFPNLVGQLFECVSARLVIKKNLMCDSQDNVLFLPELAMQKYFEGIYSRYEVRHSCLYFKGSESVFAMP